MPLVALTVTATLSGCAVVMLDGVGTTVTVGVISFTVSVTILLVTGEPTTLLTTTLSCSPLSAAVVALVVMVAVVVPVPRVKGVQVDPDRYCH